MSAEAQLPAGAAELAALVAEQVADRLAVPQDALLDAVGAAALLTVPESWVRSEARAERIPHIRLGRYVRFDRAELAAWAAARQRGPRRTGARPVPRPGDTR